MGTHPIFESDFDCLTEMGLFGSSSPFDPLLDKATNEQATSEDWSLILSICDKARVSSKNGKDCLSAITKKLGHRVPRVALQGMSIDFSRRFTFNFSTGGS